MRFFAACEKGIARFAEVELSRRFNIKPESIGNIIVFDSSMEKAVEVAYASQAVSDLCMLLSDTELPAEKMAYEQIKKASIRYKSTAEKFSVTSIASKTKDAAAGMNSFQLSNKAGREIEKITGLGLSFKEADINFTLAALKGRTLLGMSLFCTDLSKRPYRVFVNKASVSPPIAFAFLIFSGLTEKDNIIDPLAKDGTLALEAYHFLSGRPVRRCGKKEFISLFSQEMEIQTLLESIDKPEKKIGTLMASDSSFANLDAFRKNAKIAGVSKDIALAKSTLQDLDLKLMGKKINKAIALLPPLGAGRAGESLLKDLSLACSRAGIREIFLISDASGYEKLSGSGFEIIKEEKVARDKSCLYFVKAKPK